VEYFVKIRRICGKANTIAYIQKFSKLEITFRKICTEVELQRKVPVVFWRKRWTKERKKDTGRGFHVFLLQLEKTKVIFLCHSLWRK